VLEIVWLTLVWVLLWGTFTPLSIVGGVVVAVAVIGAFRFPPAEAHLPVRPLRLLGLVGYLFYDMVVSGAEVSWQVLRYGPAARGAVFEVPLLSSSDRVVTVVANALSLSPGAMALRSTMRTGCGSSTRWAAATRPGWAQPPPHDGHAAPRDRRVGHARGAGHRGTPAGREGTLTWVRCSRSCS
jgi:multisubunit Na+/H+ antiporter MnhE subunit